MNIVKNRKKKTNKKLIRKIMAFLKESIPESRLKFSGG